MHDSGDRYEFWVYRLLRNGLEAGDIFCRDSVRFRSFEDDVACGSHQCDRTRVDDEQWQKKEQLIAARKACCGHTACQRQSLCAASEAVASHRADTGLAVLKQPIKEHLLALEQMLEERIAEVNQRIVSGENEHFEMKKRGKQSRWTLQYPRESEPVNHPFFDLLKQVDIGDILHFVNQQCQFMEAFEHVLGRYVKQEMDDRVLTACIVAWATNMGLGKMGEISDIGYHTLSATSDNFIRLETLLEKIA